jgi:hypothetical protein
MKDRPDTTFGTSNDDVLALEDPTLQRIDMQRRPGFQTEALIPSEWPEGTLARVPREPKTRSGSKLSGHFGTI